MLEILLTQIGYAFMYGMLTFVFLKIYKQGTYIKRKAMDFIIKAPILSKKVDTQLCSAKQDIRKSLYKSFDSQNLVEKFDKSRLKSDILAMATNYKASDNRECLESGKISGSSYIIPDEELKSLQSEIFKIFAYANPLHPDLYASIMVMECDIIRFAIGMLTRGNVKMSENFQEKKSLENLNYCGCVTTGGTESILLACLAYRNYGRKYKNIILPEIIIAETAHAAFLKAGEYFGIKIISIPVDQNTFTYDPEILYQYITKNTICIVASAPGYPHGICDPIPHIAKICESLSIPLHIDSCLGGFLIPFLDMKDLNSLEEFYNFKQGENINNYNASWNKFLSVPGVTSVSLDSHKYGYCPKGSSILLYSNKEYLHCQYYVNTEWMGGMYPSQTLSGSRSGLNIALTWATLLHFGYDGYRQNAYKIIQCTRNIIQALKQYMESEENDVGFRILGSPQYNVIAFGNNSHSNISNNKSKLFNSTKSNYDIYELAEHMQKAKGWNLNLLQNPRGFHICITMVHVQKHLQDVFIQDMIDSDRFLRNEKEIMSNSNINEDKSKNIAALYGFSQSISDQTPMKDLLIEGYLDGYYQIS